MSKLLKEPLLHFLLAGVLLFIAVDFLGDKDNGDPRVINVNRAVLSAFMQYRAKTVDELHVSNLLGAAEDNQYQQLITDYVRDEALYREALSLNLDQNDVIIRNRLIQKMKLIAEGFVTASDEITDQEITDYFENHKARYYISPAITFAHVFFNVETRGQDAALSVAQAELARLRTQIVEFSDAVKYGDRFPFHTNYVAVAPDMLVDHFGAEMASVLFDKKHDIGLWLGPFRSIYGYHLILIARQEPGRDANLDEVHERVREDASQASSREKSQKAIQDIVDTYAVEIEN